MRKFYSGVLDLRELLRWRRVIDAAAAAEPSSDAAACPLPYHQESDSSPLPIIPLCKPPPLTFEPDIDVLLRDHLHVAARSSGRKLRPTSSSISGAGAAATSASAYLEKSRNTKLRHHRRHVATETTADSTSNSGDAVTLPVARAEPAAEHVSAVSVGGIKLVFRGSRHSAEASASTAAPALQSGATALEGVGDVVAAPSGRFGDDEQLLLASTTKAEQSVEPPAVKRGRSTKRVIEATLPSQVGTAEAVADAAGTATFGRSFPTASTAVTSHRGRGFGKVRPVDNGETKIAAHRSIGAHASAAVAAAVKPLRRERLPHEVFEFDEILDCALRSANAATASLPPIALASWFGELHGWFPHCLASSIADEESSSPSGRYSAVVASGLYSDDAFEAVCRELVNCPTSTVSASSYGPHVVVVPESRMEACAKILTPLRSLPYWGTALQRAAARRVWSDFDVVLLSPEAALCDVAHLSGLACGAFVLQAYYSPASAVHSCCSSIVDCLSLSALIALSKFRVSCRLLLLPVGRSQLLRSSTVLLALLCICTVRISVFTFRLCQQRLLECS